MRASHSTHLGLFFLSASTLMLQIALTRIFSVMLWGHYTFLVISIALLGFGAAGSWLAVRGGRHDEDEVRALLLRACLLFGVAAILSVVLASRIGLDSTRVFLETAATLKLAAVYTLIAVPFFFAGFAICVLLSAYSSQVNTIYFADLVGAGLGALSVTLLLERLGAPATIVLTAALTAGAGTLFAGRRGRAAGVAAALVFFGLTVFVWKADPWRIPVAPGKNLGNRELEVEDTRWSLHGRIDIMGATETALRFGSGVSRALYGRPVEYRTFYMDGTNPSRMIRHDQDRWFVTRLLTAGPYRLGFRSPRVLIIGSGGGIDTIVARDHGAGSVTAVEINPVTVDLVTSDYAAYIGNVFSDPRVTLRAAEGRHLLSMDDSRYDIIRLTGVDTRAAAAIGANSLDHAYLYTKEAVRDLYAHLAEDGVVAISRPGGRQTERLVNTMVAALEEQGVSDVADRLVVVSNGRWADVMLRTRPYRQEEVQAVSAWATESHLTMLYAPLRGLDPAESVRARRGTGAAPDEADEQAAGLAMAGAVTPVTDDSPFFFEPLTLGQVLRSMARFELGEAQSSGYLVLLMALLQAIVLGTLFILFPLWRNRIGMGPARGKAWAFAYFSLLGLGFILAEIVFIQKYMVLLGGPAHAMSITLFSMLVFSGLGALTAKRGGLGTGRRAAVSPAIAALLLGASVLFLKWGLPSLLGFGFGARVVLAVASIAPVSFALGLPFPLGIRILERSAPQLIPWAWACNGCLSVVGSVLAVILSMQWGFSFVLVLAAAAYAAAAVSLARMAAAAAA